ncbi:hypothetical protein ABZY14_24060 [Streptomyces sp. NPDC006617]|uniref:hypothetical protein n=1 Tax=Streptomyces sp. NPDC006617 TaxID=3155354 RepID=UPI0033A6F8C8
MVRRPFAPPIDVHVVGLSELDVGIAPWGCLLRRRLHHTELVAEPVLIGATATLAQGSLPLAEPLLQQPSGTVSDDTLVTFEP